MLGLCRDSKRKPPRTLPIWTRAHLERQAISPIVVIHHVHKPNPGLINRLLTWVTIETTRTDLTPAWEKLPLSCGYVCFFNRTPLPTHKKKKTHHGFPAGSPQKPQNKGAVKKTQTHLGILINPASGQEATAWVEHFVRFHVGKWEKKARSDPTLGVPPNWGCPQKGKKHPYCFHFVKNMF